MTLTPIERSKNLITNLPENTNEEIAKSNLNKSPSRKNLIFIFLGLAVVLVLSIILINSRRVTQQNQTSISPTIIPTIANAKVLVSLDTLTGKEVLVTENHRLIAIDPFTSTASVILNSIEGNVFEARWSPDHKKIAYLKTCSSQSCGFELILIGKNDVIKSIATSPVPPDNSYNPPGIAFSWKDASILSHSVGKSSFEFNTDTSKSISLTKSSVKDVNISPNGLVRIELDEASSSAILKNDNTKITKKLGDYPCSGYSVQFSEDSNRVAISSGCGDGGSVEIFDTDGNKITAFPSEAMSSIVKNEMSNDERLMGGEIFFIPDNTHIFFLAVSTRIVGNNFIYNKYGFLTDMSGTNIKVVNVDTLNEKR